MAKSVDVEVVGPGDELTYTVRVTNHGPSDAPAVDSVADSLPAGLTFVAASHGGTLTPGGTVRWPAFALAVGAHRDLTVTASADENIRTTTEDDGDLDNIAAVQHPGDPNPGNDHDTAVVPIDHPDLVIDHDDDRDAVDEPNDHPAPPSADEPDPGHDPPVPGLPRTGAAALAWSAIGAGLIALGLAARSFSSRA